MCSDICPLTTMPVASQLSLDWKQRKWLALPRPKVTKSTTNHLQSLLINTLYFCLTSSHISYFAMRDAVGPHQFKQVSSQPGQSSDQSQPFIACGAGLTRNSVGQGGLNFKRLDFSSNPAAISTVVAWYFYSSQTLLLMLDG